MPDVVYLRKAKNGDLYTVIERRAFFFRREDVEAVLYGQREYAAGRPSKKGGKA